jgi:hypothetical protein
MVFRERQEKVAHLQAFGRMFAAILNLDAEKAFGHIRRDYAMEVFQEMYDAKLLEHKVAALRAAQAGIAAKKSERDRMMQRLDRMAQAGGRIGSAFDAPKKPAR